MCLVSLLMNSLTPFCRPRSAELAVSLTQSQAIKQKFRVDKHDGKYQRLLAVEAETTLVINKSMSHHESSELG